MAESASIAIPDLGDESVDNFVIKLLPKLSICRVR
jgi:hypothetical protein